MNKIELVDRLIREQRKFCNEPEIQIGDLVKVTYQQLDSVKEIVQIKGWYVGANKGVYNKLILIQTHNFSPSEVQKVIQPYSQLVQKVNLDLTKEKNILEYNLQRIYVIPNSGFKWVNMTSNLVILKSGDLKFDSVTLKNEYFKLHK